MQTIGVMDSGVGGLSVLREIHRLMPEAPTVYYADQAHLPYGERSAEELLTYMDAITRFLLNHGARVIVIACNSASASGLRPLRALYPHVPIVGMEPAVKPAAAATRSGVIGVLATRATASGALYKSVVERFAGSVRVLTEVAQDMVLVAEQGTRHTPEGRAIIARHLDPLLAAGADQIALACTHFPFLMDTLRAIAGPDVGIIDPGPAVARQTRRVLPDDVTFVPTPHRYFTSGDPAQFARQMALLLGISPPVARQTL